MLLLEDGPPACHAHRVRMCSLAGGPATADDARAYGVAMQRTTVWSWLVGGVLLVGQSALTLTGAPAAGLGAAVFTMGACVVYAFGLRPDESAVGRRPGGVALLLGLGALAFLQEIWWVGPSGFRVGERAAATASLGNVAIYLLAIAAAVAIVRAGVIPAPWSWVPLAAVAFGLGLAVFFAVVVPVLAPGSPAAGTATLPATVPAVVGIVSIVLAVTTQPATPRPRVSSAAAVRHG